MDRPEIVVGKFDPRMDVWLPIPLNAAIDHLQIVRFSVRAGYFYRPAFIIA